MNILYKVVIFFSLIVEFSFIGCSSVEDTNTTSGISYLKFVNARDVLEDLVASIEVNASEVYKQSLPYGTTSSYELSWSSDKNVTFKFIQDNAQSNTLVLTSSKKKYITFVSLGNYTKQYIFPITVDGVLQEELDSKTAYIKVLNAMDDGVKKRIVFNAGESGKFIDFKSTDIIKEANAISSTSVDIVDESGNYFNTTVSIATNRAYLFVIYEDKNDTTKPLLLNIDITPPQ